MEKENKHSTHFSNAQTMDIVLQLLPHHSISFSIKMMIVTMNFPRILIFKEKKLWKIKENQNNFNSDLDSNRIGHWVQIKSVSMFSFAFCSNHQTDNMCAK